MVETGTGGYDGFLWWLQCNGYITIRRRETLTTVFSSMKMSWGKCKKKK